jgi:hypothetical protein
LEIYLYFRRENNISIIMVTKSKSYDDLEIAVQAYRWLIADDKSLREKVLVNYALWKGKGLRPDETLSNSFGIIDNPTQEDMKRLTDNVLIPLEKDAVLIRVRIGITGTSGNLLLREMIDKVPRERFQRYLGDERQMISNFIETFNELINREGLKDKKSIKALIIYPHIVAPATTWSRQRYEFVQKFITAIRDNEEDNDLKKAINSIARSGRFPVRLDESKDKNE